MFAINGRYKRGGMILLNGMSAISFSDSIIVVPGAKTKAFFIKFASGYSILIANSVAMIEPINIVLPAPIAKASM